MRHTQRWRKIRVRGKEAVIKSQDAWASMAYLCRLLGQKPSPVVISKPYWTPEEAQHHTFGKGGVV